MYDYNELNNSPANHSRASGRNVRYTPLRESKGFLSGVFYFPIIMSDIYSPARIQNRGLDPHLDVPDGAFYRDMEISSTRLDSHFTHMMPSTLQNFINAAREGRSFLDSHDSHKLGIGYTVGGIVVEEDGQNMTAITGFYTVPGINFGGQHSFNSTDDFIRAVEAGIVRDVSVGFYGGKWVCDVCGGDYRSYSSCPHWAGSMVEVHNDAGNPQQTRVTVAIHDAELSEVSAVYDGATPGAMIRKAESAARAGALDAKERRILEVRYKVALPEHERKFQGVDLSQNNQSGNEASEETITEQENSMELQINLDAVRDVITRQGFEGDVATADDVIRALNWANDELARLRPLADDGRSYRSDLIDSAIAEGVRAQGENFPSETYRDMLTRSSLDHIKQIRDQFAAEADKRFPTGRQTTDSDETEQPQEQRQTVPAAAYRS